MKSKISVIENNFRSTILLNFFPNTIIFAILVIVTMMSYLIERKTEYILLGLIFALSVETLSSWMIFMYSACYYLPGGLTELTALTIAHCLGLLLITIINGLVIYKFRLTFNLTSIKASGNQDII